MHNILSYFQVKDSKGRNVPGIHFNEVISINSQLDFYDYGDVTDPLHPAYTLITNSIFKYDDGTTTNGSGLAAGNNTIFVDLSTLNSGMYILSVKINEETYASANLIVIN